MHRSRSPHSSEQFTSIIKRARSSKICHHRGGASALGEAEKPPSQQRWLNAQYGGKADGGATSVAAALKRLRMVVWSISSWTAKPAMAITAHRHTYRHTCQRGDRLCTVKCTLSRRADRRLLKPVLEARRQIAAGQTGSPQAARSYCTSQ